MEVLSSIFYLVIVLGILVFVHEFGHFIAAKLCGMRAEIFALGMGFRLLGYNRKSGFSFGKLPKDFDGEGHTDYRICLLPIGGYVKIAGMVDESMDTEFTKNNEMQPYEFRAKKTWQKLIVLSAGVIMNVILAIAIFTGITYSVGNVVLKTTIIGEVEKKSIASKIGFVENDKVLSINNTQVKTWNDIILNLTSKEFGNDLNVKVNRNNKDTVLIIRNRAFLKLVTEKKSLGLMPGGIRTAALTVNQNSPASKSGIQPGDTILTLNDVNISTLSSLQNTVKANKGKEIEITYKRNNSVIHSKVRPNESGLIGIGLTFGPIEKEKFGFFQSLAKGAQTSYETIELIFKSFRQIIKGTIKAKDSLGGPIMIADQANQMASRGLMDFLSFMAMLSISLAILNILPIPALDGGHIIIILIEKIIRRELGEKTKILIQQIGLGLILLLMVFTFYNDIARYF